MRAKLLPIIIGIVLILASGCTKQSNQDVSKIKEKAISVGNTKYCENIEGFQLREECYTDVAIKTKDAILCEKAGSDKNRCYLRVAEKLKDVELCNKISTTSEQKDCVGWVGVATQQVSLCKQSSFPDQCILRIVDKNKDISLCQSINDPGYKRDCMNIKLVTQ